MPPPHLCPGFGPACPDYFSRLIVFAGFTAVYFKEPLSLTQSAGFALIALGAALVFRGQA